ncbi:Flp pilus assembly protein CpaB [Celeribacter indicus]|uniref:Flp pilus assembly protein CpaB n=1 Tax=Celeribacter indicus TaxID=1208324 RepID=A0A0B5DYY6_9RHOB|nr:Flp pilus assembly protein CpaB [Celeribacter indicus]AJE45931.1 Flp pilus assembly protein CpaB [Celeribacter indicus]SDW64033.1 pilus assembly protein CpaB [Celeribacter indicus]
MRAIFGLILVVGVALAGFAVHMTRGYLSTYQAELDHEKAMRATAVQTEEIFVTTAQVTYGQPILPGMVKKVRWPVEALPAEPFRTEEELFPEGPDVPRLALRTIEPMEPLIPAKVTLPGETAGVAARLSRGMRAFAIRVDVSTGVSGLLRPGDRVDVYWTGRPPGSNSEATKLIQSAIPLVAVDQTSDSEHAAATIARTVTVEATPTQVAALATAQSSGRLSLALVGRNDDTVVSGVEVDQLTLLGIERAPETVQAPAERICTVRTRKGGDIIETQIPCATN